MTEWPVPEGCGQWHKVQLEASTLAMYLRVSVGASAVPHLH